MAEDLEQDINNEQELLKHPALVEFRQLLFADRLQKSNQKKRQVRSYEQAYEFGFLSHVYYNQIENGKKPPSLSTMLLMLDKMGYEIQFKKKKNKSTKVEEVK